MRNALASYKKTCPAPLKSVVNKCERRPPHPCARSPEINKALNLQARAAPLPQDLRPAEVEARALRVAQVPVVDLHRLVEQARVVVRQLDPVVAHRDAVP